jgi:hypothetical protein
MSQNTKVSKTSKVSKKSEQVETKPVETKPVETKPVETKPVETKPVETKPVETKPVETKPVDKKTKKSKTSETSENTPVVSTATETVVAPVAVSSQEGGDSKSVKSAKTTKSTKSAKSSKSSKSTKTVKSTKSVKSSKKSTKSVQESGDKDAKGKDDRFFHCVYKSKEGTVVRAGRYRGKKPKQAARKALSRVADKNEVAIGETLVFLIKECTRGSKKKMYAYTGSRVLLEKPVSIPINKLNKDGKPVVLVYKHDKNLKKIPLSDCGDLLNVNFEEENVQQDVAAVASTPTEPSVKVTKKSTKKSSSKKDVPIQDAVSNVADKTKQEVKPVKVDKTKSKTK